MIKTEMLEFNGVKYLVRIHYEDRIDSYVSIGKREINIRIPLSLNREEQFRQLTKMKLWVQNKLREAPLRFKPEVQKEHVDGEVLKVGNEEYVLKIGFGDKQGSSARIIGNALQLSISTKLSKEQQNSHVSTLISRCVASKRLPELQRKIHELNEKHFNQKVNKIFFKHNKSNWGSCSKAGNINISTRLLFAPDDVLEYVCIHELAHLVEHNHSDKFWALVKNSMPDYEEKESWLKENRDRCKF